MAELQDRIDINVEELEENLGEAKLHEFIKASEANFVAAVDEIVDEVLSDSEKRVIFISGPTSSGKTTFTMHLSDNLKQRGRQAHFISLDDYYVIRDLRFDRDGRPDFETIDALDVDRAADDISRILKGEKVCTPYFDFNIRKSLEKDPSEAIQLESDGILVVEGLHGLSSRFTSSLNRASYAKVFIMPYGNVYADNKLFDSNDIRLLRRIVRDYRHRNAHALATIDYWPLIKKSEEKYYDEYLANADYHINSFLSYESLIIAPLAKHDIKEALEQFAAKRIVPSVFMSNSNTNKAFANLSDALKQANDLLEKLDWIPVVNPKFVPDDSILNEFISK
ncbi:MAG: Flp pilus assembly complex ATPase component TadA [Clostridia bacterium]|nr:Flp pilus assembly complex ATPase component TadA [Clostridia bacterium]